MWGAGVPIFLAECFQYFLRLSRKQYNMNNRIFRSSKVNKKPLQIVRTNNLRQSSGLLPRNAPLKQPNLGFLNSSKEIPPKIIHSQIQSPFQSQQKMISFSQTRQHRTQDSSPAQWASKRQVRKARASSSFKHNNSIKSRSMEQIMNGYIEMLQRKGVVHPHFNNYVLQAGKLTKIMAYIISAYNSAQNIPQFYQKLAKEENKFAEYMRKAEYSKPAPIDKLKFKRLLTFSSTVYEHTIINQQHAALVKQTAQLQYRQKELKREINQLRTRKEELHFEVTKKNNEFTIINFQIEKLQYDFDQYIRREEYIKSVINTKESVLADLEQRRYDIVKIFEEKQMQSIRQSFEQSKRLEDTLFLFVDFLKCHPLGQRTYRLSKRTVCNERLLEKELREIKRTLSSLSQPANQKDDILAAFLQRYHQQYRQIIEEMQEVIRGKTEFIQRYTALMDQWKEKYLKKQQILATVKDNILLEEIECQKIRQHDANRPQASGSMCKIVENIIKLFKACQPLF